MHPYLDFAGMGSGGLVIADGDFAKAEALARELATAYWERRFALEPELYAPEDAVRAGLAVAGWPGGTGGGCGLLRWGSGWR